MLQWQANYLHSYTDNMSKGYKLEFIEKVKKKNDLQSNSNKNTGAVAKSSNDKGSKICKPYGVARVG
jgi:hypothetical protein